MADPLDISLETHGRNDNVITLEPNDIIHKADNPFIPPLVPNSAMIYFRVINWVIICKAICVFGILSNTINMVVFYKTGFKESINMSLFALAVSDFGSCFTLIMSTIAMNPWLQKLDTPIAWDEVQYIIACCPHVAFAKITTLITAFITFERCLCVALPLKVKTIITRKRVISYLVMSYISVIAVYVPMFYSNQIGKRFFPGLNKTLYALVFTDDRVTIDKVVFPMSYSLFSVLPFIVIITSTTILVVKLKEKTSWRIKATAAGEKEKDEGSAKAQRVSKMVITISTLFIACFLPTTALQVVMWADRRIHIDGAYFNLSVVFSYFTFTLEAVNSSMNIFIYYRNSSNYKAVFDRLFRSTTDVVKMVT